MVSGLAKVKELQRDSRYGALILFACDRYFYDYRVQGFFCNVNLGCLSSPRITLFMESRYWAESSPDVEWMRGTVYNEREILGGYADEI